MRLAPAPHIYTYGVNILDVSRILEKRFAEAYEAAGGENILGCGILATVMCRLVAELYLWRETALLRSLEGKRGATRALNRPSCAVVYRLWGCPTVVNNVETIAAVCPIVMMGNEEYANRNRNQQAQN